MITDLYVVLRTRETIINHHFNVQMKKLSSREVNCLTRGRKVTSSWVGTRTEVSRVPGIALSSIRRCRFNNSRSECQGQGIVRIHFINFILVARNRDSLRVARELLDHNPWALIKAP